MTNVEKNRRTAQRLAAKQDAARAKRIADEAYIESLDEGTESQLRKLEAALKSDDRTAASTGFNTEFKVTTKKGLTRIKNAKKARVTAINKPAKAKAIKATVNSEGMEILSWSLKQKPVKADKGNSRTKANLSYTYNN